MKSNTIILIVIMIVIVIEMTPSTTVTRIDLSCNQLTEKGGEMVKIDFDHVYQ